MIKNIILFSFILLFLSQCTHEQKDSPIIESLETKKIDTAAILKELDKYNTETICIYETPTYKRLANDPNIQTHIKNRMDIINLFEQTDYKLDSIRLTKTDSTITINELFFIHGHYGFVPSYIINDTSVQIRTIEVVIAELDYYSEKKELMTTDVTIACAAEIITILKILKRDRNKPVYYNSRKLKTLSP